jgi:DNA polymerase I-like protein with 3'-5' exonuclease and polymerase domains
VDVRLVDGQLEIAASTDALSPELRAEVAARKHELVAALQAEAAGQVGPGTIAPAVARPPDAACPHPHVIVSNGVAECQLCDMRRRLPLADETDAPAPDGEASEQLVADGRDIVAALADRGISLRLGEDGRPLVGPAELIDEADRALLAGHRDAVLAALRIKEPPALPERPEARREPRLVETGHLACPRCSQEDYLPLGGGWRRCWPCGRRWGPAGTQDPGDPADLDRIAARIGLAEVPRWTVHPRAGQELTSSSPEAAIDEAAADYPKGVLCHRDGCRGLGWRRDPGSGGWRCRACGGALAFATESGLIAAHAEAPPVRPEAPRERMAVNGEYVSMLHIDVPGGDPRAIDQIAEVLPRHPGSDEVQLHIVSGDRVVTMEVGERFRVTAGPAVKAELDACFGREVARLEPAGSQPAAADDDDRMPGVGPAAGIVSGVGPAAGIVPGAFGPAAEHRAPTGAGLEAAPGDPADALSASQTPAAVAQAPAMATGALVPGQEGRPASPGAEPTGGSQPGTDTPLALFDRPDAQRRDPEPAGGANGGGAAPPRIEAGAQAFDAEPVLVTTAAELERALPEILAAPALGFDTEGTGLDPLTARVRLVQFATVRRTYLVDVFRLPLPALQPIIDGAQRLVGHNLKFDLRMLMAGGIRLPADIGRRISDTMLAGMLLGAGLDGLRHRLGDLTQRYLGVELDKTEQVSDWSGELTGDQLAYAARDAAVLLPLRDQLRVELERAGLNEVAGIEHRALPALVWLEQTGAPFDQAAWLRLAAIAEERRRGLERELEAMAPSEALRLPLSGLEEGSTRWSSPAQVRRLLESRGVALPDTRDVTLHEHHDDDPLIPLLLEHRDAAKRSGSFGSAFLRFVHPVSGRIHADFFQLGSAAGRMACRNPNLQQMPRDLAYRACVQAPAGRVLIKTDYCLHPDTGVETVAGIKRIGDIVPGDKVFTLRGRRIAWGEVTRTVVTGELPCYRLTFDNGQSVIASADHRWPVRVRDRSIRGLAYLSVEKRTAELRVGERMVPMRRTAAQGYMHLYAYSAFEYSKQHVLVAEATHGPRPEGAHVHHRNHDRTDNRPENLLYEMAHEHRAYHGRESYGRQDPEQRRARIDRLREGLKRRRSYAGAGNPNFGKRRGSTSRCLFCDRSFYRWPSARGKFCSRECYHAAQRDGLNHKLASIEYLGPQPTVAITVEPDHNYVLACGVVTCNSQIELRIAAEIAGDRRLLEAYDRGVDVHELTARQVLGRTTVTKADRQAAKSLNFGLLFGMGAVRLRSYAKFAYGVDMTDQEATAYRERFFEMYKGLRHWHRSLPEGTIETRTLAGRRRLGVERFTEKANSPVQGSAADGLKLALGRLHETRDEVPSVAPVLTVHDEIVLECDQRDAEPARAWLERCMREGMGELLKRVPVEVEGQVGFDWSMRAQTAEDAA